MPAACPSHAALATESLLSFLTESLSPWLPPYSILRIVEKSIKGMLPHTSYGRELFRHLKVYAGKEHPHAAQAPEPLEFAGLTSTPDSKVLNLVDPDAAILCV